MSEPQLKVTVAASLRATNGVEVTINETEVRFTQPGARGGAGVHIAIPLREWDLIAGGVERLRAAIADAKARVGAER